MTQLLHIFAKGLRFDTQVQYTVSGASGRRYRNLPLGNPDSVQAADSGPFCLAQCVAVLGQLPFNEAAAHLSRRGFTQDGRWMDGAQIHLGEASIRMRLVESGLPAAIGSAAGAAVQHGHMCMVQFCSAKSSVWVTVTGVEMDSTTGHIRTLLLLDPTACEPWGTCHNTRLELLGKAGRAVPASAGYGLHYRHLDGKASAVRLQGLLVLSL
ncbi:hypothetical protein [Rhodoferax sp. GW822-FHT02A01]|uniref:hypothetical protein n=1 Tax=Rhodoferax sp. GW822-FHT02A01 TaxID=3141537 RepID=UPI00315D3B67